MQGDENHQNLSLTQVSSMYRGSAYLAPAQPAGSLIGSPLTRLYRGSAYLAPAQPARCCWKSRLYYTGADVLTVGLPWSLQVETRAAFRVHHYFYFHVHSEAACEYLSFARARRSSRFDSRPAERAPRAERQASRSGPQDPACSSELSTIRLVTSYPRTMADRFTHAREKHLLIAAGGAEPFPKFCANGPIQTMAPRKQTRARGWCDVRGPARPGTAPRRPEQCVKGRQDPGRGPPAPAPASHIIRPARQGWNNGGG